MTEYKTLTSNVRAKNSSTLSYIFLTSLKKKLHKLYCTRNVFFSLYKVDHGNPKLRQTHLESESLD